eukprot:4315080-Amphidinium_carterae.1
MAHIPKRTPQHGLHVPSSEVMPPELKPGQKVSGRKNAKHIPHQMPNLFASHPLGFAGLNLMSFLRPNTYIRTIYTYIHAYAFMLSYIPCLVLVMAPEIESYEA